MKHITSEFIKKDIKNYGLSQFYTSEGMWSVFCDDLTETVYNAILTNGKDKTVSITLQDDLDFVLERINKGIS